MNFSQIINDWRKHEAWSIVDRASDDPASILAAGIALGSVVGKAQGLSPEESVGLGNLGALITNWWHTKSRAIWRLNQEAVERIGRTGIAFIPAEPPTSWFGRAFLVESGSGQLIPGYHSLGIYFADPDPSTPRYHIIGLSGSGGDDFAVSIRADLGAVNDKLARAGEILDQPNLGEAGLEGAPLEHHGRVLAALRFLFSLSFYLSTPDPPAWEPRDSGQGPPLRVGKKKKVAKVDGKKVHLWAYRDLSFGRPEPEAGDNPPESLATEGLNLAPTVVRAHWRRLPSGKITLIPAHASKRWRRD